MCPIPRATPWVSGNALRSRMHRLGRPFMALDSIRMPAAGPNKSVGASAA